jgi:hypothetical protein
VGKGVFFPAPADLTNNGVTSPAASSEYDFVAKQ